MFKVKLGIAPSFMDDIWERVIPSNSVVNGLRHQLQFYNAHPKLFIMELKH